MLRSQDHTPESLFPSRTTCCSSGFPPVLHFHYSPADGAVALPPFFYFRDGDFAVLGGTLWLWPLACLRISESDATFSSSVSLGTAVMIVDTFLVMEDRNARYEYVKPSSGSGLISRMEITGSYRLTTPSVVRLRPLTQESCIPRPVNPAIPRPSSPSG